MRDSLKKKKDTLESIPTKPKPYSTVHTVHTVHHEPRFPVEIRMRKSIHGVVRRYCGNSDMSFGEFYERAAIMFMDVNPVEFFGANVIMPEICQQNIDDQLREIICVDELQDFLSKAKLVKGTLHVSKKKTAIGILKECSKINKRSDELEALMYEVMEVIR